MRSLLITENFPPKTGGSGRWFWEIYRRLPREQFVIAAGEHPRHEEFDGGHDLRVIRTDLTLKSWGVLGWRSLKDHWRLLSRIRGIVKEDRIDYLHCGRILPEGMPGLFLKKWGQLPYLCYVHGEELTYSSASRELGWWTRQVIRGADVLIANSSNTRELLQRQWGVPDDKVRVLHPGVDTERFVPAAKNVMTRRRLGWGDRPVILTVGRLQKRKGHDMMIRALATIKQRYPDVLYSIVGDGEEREALRELAAELMLEGHVQFRGETSDEEMVECYQQCDLFALPNRQVGQDFEGFGMVLLEAQACGRPVLAGASGGTSETMRIPETGRVVCCDEPSELAAVVIDLLSDPARLDRMGAAGREWVVEQFDWDPLTRQAEAVFLSARATCLPAASGVRIQSNIPVSAANPR